ncbi:hypothetical protein Hanom_Chr05g00402891 [Helianthus anomalus]
MPSGFCPAKMRVGSSTSLYFCSDHHSLQTNLTNNNATARITTATTTTNITTTSTAIEAMTIEKKKKKKKHIQKQLDQKKGCWVDFG